MYQGYVGDAHTFGRGTPLPAGRQTATDHSRHARTTQTASIGGCQQLGSELPLTSQPRLTVHRGLVVWGDGGGVDVRRGPAVLHKRGDLPAAPRPLVPHLVAHTVADEWTMVSALGCFKLYRSPRLVGERERERVYVGRVWGQ
jgi:hypothetical protein